MKIAALYAQVSGEQQRDGNTIASQTEALVAYAELHGYTRSARHDASRLTLRAPRPGTAPSCDAALRLVRAGSQDGA